MVQPEHCLLHDCPLVIPAKSQYLIIVVLFFYNGILPLFIVRGVYNCIKYQKCQDDCMRQDILINSMKSGVASLLPEIWFELDKVGGSLSPFI